MSLVKELKAELFDNDPDKNAFDVYYELAKRFSLAFSAEIVPAGGFDPMETLRDAAPLGKEIVHIAFSKMYEGVMEDARTRAAYSVAYQSHLNDSADGTEERLAALNELRLTAEAIRD